MRIGRTTISRSYQLSDLGEVKVSCLPVIDLAHERCGAVCPRGMNVARNVAQHGVVIDVVHRDGVCVVRIFRFFSEYGCKLLTSSTGVHFKKFWLPKGCACQSGRHSWIRGLLKNSCL